MSETPVCEICGRGYTEEEGHLTGERGPAACYRIGLEKALGALSAAEKQVEQLVGDVRAISEDYTEAKARADAAEKREARLLGLLRGLCAEALASQHGDGCSAYATMRYDPSKCDCIQHSAHVALELASAASEAQPPPEAIFVPGAQEGEK